MGCLLFSGLVGDATLVFLLVLFVLELEVSACVCNAIALCGVVFFVLELKDRALL